MDYYEGEEEEEEDLEALLRLSVSDAVQQQDHATAAAPATAPRPSAGSPLSFSNTASPPKVVERRDSKVRVGRMMFG